MQNRRVVRVSLVVGLTLLAASPAFAGTRSINGSSTRHSGGLFYVADTQPDGHSVYGNYRGTSANRLQNSEGYGTELSKNVGTIGSHRACVDISFAEDPCGAYGS